MSINSFGRMFRFTTWGESHGSAIGVTVDGCPPNITIKHDELQFWLDRRRPGQNKFTSQRRESDSVEILSGLFKGKTTGTPIQLLIKNKDQRSRDYSDIAEKFRPGHADFTYWQKYGIRDYRGGGRSSARETASRVAAGGIARAILNALTPSISIYGFMAQMGSIQIDKTRFCRDEIERNQFWSPDAEIVGQWSDALKEIRKSGDSVGALVEVRASGVPVGLGAPIYGKLDSDLAAALMTINAVKAVEIGDGMDVVKLKGSENADEMSSTENGIEFSSNHAGGILGGISTGQEVVARLAVKPASSIMIPKKTIQKDGTATDIVTKGRHDPCVGIRAVPVAEAMMACVLVDHLLLHRGQVG